MKKLLLTSALVGGLAFAASPAMAEVSLGLDGFFKGYVTWNDQDEDPDVGVGDSAEANSFDIVRSTEIQFTGESVLDNGLTVGFHAEMFADTNDDMQVQESYAFFAGNWGRVNFGGEDGAAFLLQIAAPAADSNIDGLRQTIASENYALAPDADGPATYDFSSLAGTAFDYAQDFSGYSDKITYITPVFNGFQAAATYSPNNGDANAFGVGSDDVENAFDNVWEIAARYEGQFNAVRMALGAGYTHANLEDEDATPGTGDFTDDFKEWNVGANLGFGPFNVGAVYLHNNGADEFDAAGATSSDSDTRTWVIGADYTTGPFVLGASYYDRQAEQGTVDDLDTKRYSGGVTYTYGPGMTFRGSVHHIEHEVGSEDFDSTSVLLGTQIGF
jgi:predicted porin